MALVWFRNDLRTGDNPALYEAMNYVKSKINSSKGKEDARNIIGLVLFNRHHAEHIHGWGYAKTDYYLRSVKALRASLAEYGVPLHFHELSNLKNGADIVEVKKEKGWINATAAALLSVCQSHGIQTIFYNKEYEGFSIRRDVQVEAVLEANGISLLHFHDQCAVEPGKVLTKGGTPYKIFSQFKKTWAAVLNDGKVIPDIVIPNPDAFEKEQVKEVICTECRNQSEDNEIKDLEHNVAQDAFKDDPSRLGIEKIRQRFPAGEIAAKQTLQTFLSNSVRRYSGDRNVYIPLGEARTPNSSASFLSAPLAVGSISLRQCLFAAWTANGSKSLLAGDAGLVCWMSELCWRDFYRHVLVHFPHVGDGHAFRPEYEELSWRAWPPATESDASDKIGEEFYKLWCEGRTGVPIVDAAMRQISTEAWMNNRLRMVVAMYLTKDLLVHWRRGEEYFRRRLIDYDFSSNNGGWQWSASTGTDAQPYFRIFNPYLQSEKFDPNGEYIAKWVPELSQLRGNPMIHQPNILKNKIELSPDYPPKPLVDHKEVRGKVLAMFTGSSGKKNEKRSLEEDESS